MIEKKDIPEVVSLVALGHSKIDFLHEAVTCGNKRGVADEVWVINKLGVLVEHDMLFRMDDLTVKYDCNNKRFTGGNAGKEGVLIHDEYENFLRNHTKPIITSKAYPEYPTSVEYPLEGVINHIGYSYFRTTPAYAAAFASYIGVKQLRIYGCDYVYPDEKYRGEAGRANMEFILGVCMAMGMEVHVSPKSTLMDSMIPVTERMYGYKDPVDVKPDPNDESRWIVESRPDVGDKLRKEKYEKETAQLQTLLSKYNKEVKRDIIDGKWITKEDIDRHFSNRDSKGRFKKKAKNGTKNT
jgi:hypothetical protein